jgi:hypothetical protein
MIISMPKKLLSALTFGATIIAPNLLWAAGASKSEARDSPFTGQSQIAATVMQSSRPIGVLQVDVGILVPNSGQRQRAASLQPVLRDGWRRTTQEFANRYYVRGQVPDANLLGQRLQIATDQVLGAGNARVLLTSVIVR